MKTASAAFAALILGTTSFSASHAQSTTAVHLLERLDTNRDGTVSKDEIAATRERLFERLDLNADGAIDDEEIEALRDAIMDRAVAAQARLGSQWRRMDPNGDGRVSSDEFRARTVLFDLADRDGDGKLSAVEFIFMRSLILGSRG